MILNRVWIKPLGTSVDFFSPFGGGTGFRLVCVVIFRSFSVGIGRVSLLFVFILLFHSCLIFWFFRSISFLYFRKTGQYLS